MHICSFDQCVLARQFHLSLMFCSASSPVLGISCRYGHSAPRLHSPLTKKLQMGALFLCTAKPAVSSELHMHTRLEAPEHGGG